MIILFPFWPSACDNSLSGKGQHVICRTPAGGSDSTIRRYEHDACGVGFVVDIKGRRSHGVIARGLQVLINLLHRGACGCEANTGDGAGILIQMPDRFLRKVTAPLGIDLPAGRPLRRGPGVSARAIRGSAISVRRLFERIVAEEGQEPLGWRPVPTSTTRASARPRSSACRSSSRCSSATAPLQAPTAVAPIRCAFERKLYVIRKRVEHAVDALTLAERHALLHPQPVVAAP